jgi:hypothetical protein
MRGITAFVRHAQPEVVGRRRAQLRRDEARRDVRGELAHGRDRGGPVGAVDEVLALDLVAVRRDPVEPEVGQAFEPWPRYAALQRAVVEWIRGGGARRTHPEDVVGRGLSDS